MKTSKLTDKQKERLRVLEPKLKIAISNRDFKTSKLLVADLQALLRPTGHLTRLIQSKNRLYELALELNEMDIAIAGLKSNLATVNKKTRLFLEASALLAICYLRLEEIELAKPLIKDVLTNDTVIKSQKTRKKFRIEIINRFNEETALYSLKNKDKEEISIKEIDKEVGRILMTQNESEIYATLGKSVPQHTKYLLLEVHQYSLKQLPSAERLALPSAEQKVEEKELGKTVFQSMKRVLYNSLCDSESEIYKIWYTNGMEIILSKGYIGTAVINLMTNLGIGMKMLSASIIALILKFGLEVYCEKNKPLDLMELRGN